MQILIIYSTLTDKCLPVVSVVSHDALHARQLKRAVYLEMLSLEAVESWLSMW